MSKIYNTLNKSAKLLGLPSEFLYQEAVNNRIPYVTFDRVMYFNVTQVTYWLDEQADVVVEQLRSKRDARIARELLPNDNAIKD